MKTALKGGGAQDPYRVVAAGHELWLDLHRGAHSLTHWKPRRHIAMSLRRVILAAAALMALPSLALAQTSRVEGMALQGDYIKDYTGIYTYTSGVVNVGNLVYGELGNAFFDSATFDRSLGAVLQNLFDGRLGTWGIHPREETPQLGQGDAFATPNFGVGGSDPNTNTNESF